MAGCALWARVCVIAEWTSRIAQINTDKGGGKETEFPTRTRGKTPVILKSGGEFGRFRRSAELELNRNGCGIHGERSVTQDLGPLHAFPCKNCEISRSALWMSRD